jgi:hypothetical protein
MNWTGLKLRTNLDAEDQAVWQALNTPVCYYISIMIGAFTADF